jgi:osmotically-inducible protein OsmY
MFYLNILKRSLTISVLVLAIIAGINSSLLASNKSLSLSQKVSNAISNNYYQNFSVTANKKGIVKIEGQVKTLYNKYNIFDIASKVPGVKGIEDFISVNAPIRPKDFIKYGIENKIDLDNSILEPNRIKVNVAGNGLVILSGEVSYPEEKLEAETIASWQKGASGIINLIKVLPKKIATSNKNIRFVVHDIIKDDFPLDKSTRLSVNKGIVTINGHSDDIWGIDHLLKDCDKIEGVKKVIDDIKPTV